MVEIVTRDEARSLGLRHYSTGKPCRRGHTSPRRTSSGACIECVRAANKNRVATIIAKELARLAAWQIANKERFRAAQRRWRAKNRDRVLAADATRRAANREKINIRARLRYAANREKAHARQRPWREANRDVTRKAAREWNKTPAGRASKIAVRHNRRAAIKGTIGSATKEQIASLMQRATHCCYCGSRFTKSRPKTLEHVIPLARGGSNELSNLSVACRSCNSAKGDRITMLL
jgi:5-methylcytosine-specific restriction endonuclease McrA